MQWNTVHITWNTSNNHIQYVILHIIISGGKASKYFCGKIEWPLLYGDCFPASCLRCTENLDNSSKRILSHKKLNITCIPTHINVVAFSTLMMLSKMWADEVIRCEKICTSGTSCMGSVLNHHPLEHTMKHFLNKYFVIWNSVSSTLPVVTDWILLKVCSYLTVSN